MSIRLLGLNSKEFCPTVTRIKIKYLVSLSRSFPETRLDVSPRSSNKDTGFGDDIRIRTFVLIVVDYRGISSRLGCACLSRPVDKHVIFSTS